MKSLTMLRTLNKLPLLDITVLTWSAIIIVFCALWMRSYIFDMRVLRRAAYGDTRLISVAAGQLSLEHVAKRSRSAPYRCEFSSTPIIQGGRSRTFFLSLREQFGWLRCATAVRDGTRIRTIA